MSVLRLNDYPVPGFDLHVSLGLDFKTSDASGDTSSTARADKGTKGKKLDVKLKVKYEDAQRLQELVTVAEAKSGGEGKLYTITNNTANAANMRMGRFSGSFRVDEQDNLHLWLVSFSLEEHKSVPEQAEKRQAKPGTAPQTNQGESVSAGSGEGEAEQPRELNLLEQGFKWLDDKLAD